MPSVYHLHPNPSHSDFGLLITPSPSPGRSFVSPYARFNEVNMASTTACTCAHSMFVNGKGCCAACLERQQKRHHRLSDRPTTVQPLTPPPSDLATPSPSARASSHDSPVRRGRPSLAQTRVRVSSSVIDVWNNAFTSQEEHPGIFPDSFYTSRVRRTSSRGSPSTSPMERTSSTITPRVDPVVESLARASTLPEAGVSGSAVRDYSPMAAGFARLSRKEVRHASPRNERGALDLHARMFDGAV